MFAKYKQVVCADGFKMSVQAGPRSYSYPKDDVGPYTEVEVGFPSHYEGLLIPYAENPDNPTETVYGYTPARVVLNVLAKHGGIVSGARLQSPEQKAVWGWYCSGDYFSTRDAPARAGWTHSVQKPPRVSVAEQ